MEKTICLILAFVAILIIACNNQKQTVNENLYTGAWEITYTKYVYPDTTNENANFDNPNVPEGFILMLRSSARAGGSKINILVSYELSKSGISNLKVCNTIFVSLVPLLKGLKKEMPSISNIG